MYVCSTVILILDKQRGLLRGEKTFRMWNKPRRVVLIEILFVLDVSLYGSVCKSPSFPVALFHICCF